MNDGRTTLFYNLQKFAKISNYRYMYWDIGHISLSLYPSKGYFYDLTQANAKSFYSR